MISNCPASSGILVRTERGSARGEGAEPQEATTLVIFGASGMIGSCVLLECLADSRVSAVLAASFLELPEAQRKYWFFSI